jgi:hypothetical protein
VSSGGNLGQSGVLIRGQNRHFSKRVAFVVCQVHETHFVCQSHVACGCFECSIKCSSCEIPSDNVDGLL